MVESQTVPDEYRDEVEWLTNSTDAEAGDVLLNLTADEPTQHEIVGIDSMFASIVLPDAVNVWVSLTDVQTSGKWVAVYNGESDD